eukprot:CAMPEP_0170471952 /NCGR_PEP_ID=MMETSP0123-20130129/14074_1 /TAXON_ID=182087 /ORGANISM="Favella ehrenbergii, Strain Fehren 1" /LENGTH=97 /DNA_ID=CAMNT_0010739919 /DNA_START=245 /DNA_END=534 /DNA_ORIENTATION=+
MLFRKGPELATHAWEKSLPKVFILVEAGLQIVKAELMMTATTRHMIAAFKLVDNDGALWTFDSTIVSLPILKVFIFFGLAALAALVRFLTAREAHKR